MTKKKSYLLYLQTIAFGTTIEPRTKTNHCLRNVNNHIPRENFRYQCVCPAMYWNYISKYINLHLWPPSCPTSVKFVLLRSKLSWECFLKNTFNREMKSYAGKWNRWISRKKRCCMLTWNILYLNHSFYWQRIRSKNLITVNKQNTVLWRNKESLAFSKKNYLLAISSFKITDLKRYSIKTITL